MLGPYVRATTVIVVPLRSRPTLSGHKPRWARPRLLLARRLKAQGPARAVPGRPVLLESTGPRLHLPFLAMGLQHLAKRPLRMGHKRVGPPTEPRRVRVVAIRAHPTTITSSGDAHLMEDKPTVTALDLAHVVKGRPRSCTALPITTLTTVPKGSR